MTLTNAMEQKEVDGSSLLGGKDVKEQEEEKEEENEREEGNKKPGERNPLTTLDLRRMESILRDMQHTDSGIPVRCQKIFLTTIPCAFTGYDLIEWLMEKLQISDSMEALHLANLLCQHGYFFPVTDTKSFVVKDDSSLYRFQSPYFWPSQNWRPDNVDYAIYLAKRSMRNKQRHGLEDYEQTAFNKLQKMLCDKWEFIYMQAEEQVRMAKERKKADKVVLDSQEKAFWRVHKPPPGQINCLEEGIRRNYKPSQMAQRKKKTVESYKKEIAFLQQSMMRPRMKTSKATEGLIQRCEQYHEHDPFLSPPQPSNPWISDDTTMWVLNSCLVDTPTDRRVKMWSFGFDELLSDPKGRQEFELFLKKEFSQENIRFWQSCEDLKDGPASQIQEKVEEIYREFLAPGAPCEINIDSKTMENTQNGLKKPDRFTFEAAQAHIYLLMKKDSYQRFLRSEHYKNLLATAIQPSGKKKFFNFGSNRKKTPTPSPQAKRRGSTSSEQNRSGSSSRLAQHSFSTGNLQDLDGQGDRGVYLGPGDESNGKEDNSVYVGSKNNLSPNSLRKKLDNISKGDSPTQSNLAVPTQYTCHSPESTDDEGSNQCLALAVPSPMNVVAPWEDYTDA